MNTRIHHIIAQCLGPGVNTPPTLKPTWEPTMHPMSLSPTTTLHYWNEQNKHDSDGQNSTINSEPESDSGSTPLWTAAPSLRPTYSPTEDQCRAPPCDNTSECRSGLGFCGTGIVYCNSMSSWKPECIGGASQLESGPRITPQPTFANKGGPPSISPTTKWQGWVQSNYAADTPAPAATELDGNATEAASNNTAESLGLQETSQPSKEPVDPFSWSGGTFDGETYSAYDSDSPWWSQGASASSAFQANICSFLQILPTIFSSWYYTRIT
jgi:hypothetical protein